MNDATSTVKIKNVNKTITIEALSAPASVSLVLTNFLSFPLVNVSLRLP